MLGVCGRRATPPPRTSATPRLLCLSGPPSSCCSSLMRLQALPTLEGVRKESTDAMRLLCGSGCVTGDPPTRALAWVLVPTLPLIVRVRKSLQSPVFSVTL